jgi:mono/diheme cytochrome c family protein
MEHPPIPPGWNFTLPSGNPHAGKEVFVKFECYKCHAVKGEDFGVPAIDIGEEGPELSVMASLHPPAYFAEAIMHPNAVVDKRYAAPDGNSKMPNYNEDMTIKELIDLVAYLKSLTGAASEAQPKHH